jgi:hypothetical protein
MKIIEHFKLSDFQKAQETKERKSTPMDYGNKLSFRIFTEDGRLTKEYHFINI